jgi:hypothetical protein
MKISNRDLAPREPPDRLRQVGWRGGLDDDGPVEQRDGQAGRVSRDAPDRTGLGPGDVFDKLQERADEAPVGSRDVQRGSIVHGPPIMHHDR